MKINIFQLRKIIREEIERNMRWTAGFFGGHVAQPSKGSNYMPLPGLGASVENYDNIEEREHEDEKEEYSGQSTSGERGQPRAIRRS